MCRHHRIFNLLHFVLSSESLFTRISVRSRIVHWTRLVFCLPATADPVLCAQLMESFPRLLEQTCRERWLLCRDTEQLRKLLILLLVAQQLLEHLSHLQYDLAVGQSALVRIPATWRVQISCIDKTSRLPASICSDGSTPIKTRPARYHHRLQFRKPLPRTVPRAAASWSVAAVCEVWLSLDCRNWSLKSSISVSPWHLWRLEVTTLELAHWDKTCPRWQDLREPPFGPELFLRLEVPPSPVEVLVVCRLCADVLAHLSLASGVFPLVGLLCKLNDGSRLLEEAVSLHDE